jgi:hypothetical protein
LNDACGDKLIREIALINLVEMLVSVTSLTMTWLTFVDESYVAFDNLRWFAFTLAVVDIQEFGAETHDIFQADLIVVSDNGTKNKADS